MNCLLLEMKNSFVSFMIKKLWIGMILSFEDNSFAHDLDRSGKD